MLKREDLIPKNKQLFINDGDSIRTMRYIFLVVTILGAVAGYWFHRDVLFILYLLPSTIYLFLAWLVVRVGNSTRYRWLYTRDENGGVLMDSYGVIQLCKDGTRYIGYVGPFSKLVVVCENGTPERDVVDSLFVQDGRVRIDGSSTLNAYIRRPEK